MKEPSDRTVEILLIVRNKECVSPCLIQRYMFHQLTTTLSVQRHLAGT